MTLPALDTTGQSLTFRMHGQGISRALEMLWGLYLSLQYSTCISYQIILQFHELYGAAWTNELTSDDEFCLWSVKILSVDVSRSLLFYNEFYLWFTLIRPVISEDFQNPKSAMFKLRPIDVSVYAVDQWSNIYALHCNLPYILVLLITFFSEKKWQKMLIACFCLYWNENILSCVISFWGKKRVINKTGMYGRLQYNA